MQHLELDRQFHIPSRQEDNYYHQYCRLYLANVVLTTQVKDLIQQKNQLQARLSRYQDDDAYSSQDQNNPKNKRFRRNAHQIQRFYRCCIKQCAKSYGSEGSLNQHYKLKHPQIYITLPSVQQTCHPLYKQNQNLSFNSLRHNTQDANLQNSFNNNSSLLKQSKALNQVHFEDYGFEAQSIKKQNQVMIEGKNQNISYSKRSRTRK